MMNNNTNDMSMRMSVKVGKLEVVRNFKFLGLEACSPTWNIWNDNICQIKLLTVIPGFLNGYETRFLKAK